MLYITLNHIYFKEDSAIFDRYSFLTINTFYTTAITEGCSNEPTRPFLTTTFTVLISIMHSLTVVPGTYHLMLENEIRESYNGIVPAA